MARSENKDTRRRQGDKLDLSDRCLEILDTLNALEFITAAKFKEMTGLSPASLVDWRNRKKAACGALVDLCKRLNCWPEEIGLPERTATAVKRWLSGENPPWQPSGESVLVSLMGGAQYQPRLPGLAANWTGRVGEMNQLMEAFAGRCRIVELHGPSGLGKSALARHFIDALARAKDIDVNRDVLWWSFAAANEDAFVEEIPRFLYPRGPIARLSGIHELLAAIFKKRFLIVLDGLERTQDSEGKLQDDRLAILLSEAAKRDHRSLFLITTERPLPSLKDCSSVLPLPLGPLLDDDASSLLLKIGVKGPEASIRQVAADLGNNPLFLQVVGSCLLQDHGGEVQEVPVLPTHGNSLEFLEQIVSEVAQLDQAGQDFMRVLSVFRKPVHRLAITSVFAKATERLESLSETGLSDLLGKLRNRALIGEDGRTGLFRPSHSHIQQLFRMKLAPEWDADQVKKVHTLIMRHYLADRGRKLPEHPNLEDLSPYLEAAFHGLQAGLHDQVWAFGTASIIQEQKFTLVAELQAFGSMLEILLAFLPVKDGQPDEEGAPMVSDPVWRAHILRGIALCQRNLGHIGKSLRSSRRAIEAAEQAGEWTVASFACQNLALAYMHRDKLIEACEFAEKGISFAEHSDIARVRDSARALRGLVAQLQGEPADRYFDGIDWTESAADGQRPWILSAAFAAYRQFLWHSAQFDRCRQTVAVAIRFAENQRQRDDLVRCLVLQGQLEMEAAAWTRAEQHLDNALAQVRTLQHKLLLVEVLIHLYRVKKQRRKKTEAAAILDEVQGYLSSGEFPYWERILRERTADPRRVDAR